MSVNKNSIKQKIRNTAKKLQTFTRPELYCQIYELNNKPETARREFSYLIKMGVIKKTEKQKNNLAIYEYIKNPVRSIKYFF